MRQARQAGFTRGFTLIELMIVVVVISILAAIGMPMYGDYTRRGKITEATSTLSDLRIRAERFFADNRTYVGFNQTTAGTRYFTYVCVTPTAATYSCTATGVANQGMTGFVYTVDQSNTKGSTITGLSGWNNSSTCWITKKGDTC